MTAIVRDFKSPAGVADPRRIFVQGRFALADRALVVSCGSPEENVASRMSAVRLYLDTGPLQRRVP